MDFISLKVLNIFFVWERIPVLVLIYLFIYFWSYWKNYVTWLNNFFIFCDLIVKLILFLIRYCKMSEFTFIPKTLIIWKDINRTRHTRMQWMPHIIFLFLILKPLCFRYCHTNPNTIFFLLAYYLFFGRIFNLLPILNFISISTLWNL